MNIAAIFAAGLGTRLNNPDLTPKQFISVQDKPILIHTLQNFENHNLIDKIFVAVNSEYLNHTQNLISNYGIKKVEDVIEGGECAMDTIYKLLSHIKTKNKDNPIVLIHDGVRPIINQKVITDNIKTTLEKSNAITVIPSNETMVISNNSLETSKVPKRKTVYKAQAPQTFYLNDILNAHEKIRKTNKNYTDIVDNCSLCYELKIKTNLVEGNFGNIKITTIEDIYLLKGIIEALKKEKKLD